MAHFYGTIQGSRGEASRLGTERSGLRAKIASWQGAVSVQLYSRDGLDCARISLTKHRGSGVERLLFDGRLDGEDTYDDRHLLDGVREGGDLLTAALDMDRLRNTPREG